MMLNQFVTVRWTEAQLHGKCITGNILFTGFNLAEVVRMEIHLFCEPLVREAGRLSLFTNSIANDFPLLRERWHGPNAPLAHKCDHSL